MAKLWFWVLGAMIVTAGCGGSPTAPGALPQQSLPLNELATISGRIYGSDVLEPPLGGVTVKVNEADGSTATVASDADGFYRVSARRGTVTITASSEGYQPKQWQFNLSADTVLNFSLDSR